MDLEIGGTVCFDSLGRLSNYRQANRLLFDDIQHIIYGRRVGPVGRQFFDNILVMLGRSVERIVDQVLYSLFLQVFRPGVILSTADVDIDGSRLEEVFLEECRDLVQ